MALKVPCPNCGWRPSTEFAWGGELRPVDSPDAESDFERVFLPENAAGSAGRALVPSPRLPAVDHDHPRHDDERGPIGGRKAASRPEADPRSRTETRSHRRCTGRASAPSRGRSSTTAAEACSAGRGECPNCLVTVDGVPGVRSCVTPAQDGMRVRRHGGWPSVERDVLAILDRVHALLPVGFYYKTFIRPRWTWSVADRAIRRAVGLGRLPERSGRVAPSRHLQCDVLVVGAGRRASGGRRGGGAGASMRCCATRARWRIPRKGSTSSHHPAIGRSKGRWWRSRLPTALVEVHPTRIVIATGGAEVHPVFPGNDLPGVMLGRGAAGLMERGVKPGRGRWWRGARRGDRASRGAPVRRGAHRAG